MSRFAARTYRLFLDAPLAADAAVPLSREQANYLLNVLRLRAGDAVLAFNGRDGEWRAEVVADGRRDGRLRVLTQTRPQAGGPDLHCLFAPLKRARLDYLVQKMVELGAARLRPVLTQHTQAERTKGDRMRANVIEAAEQCGILRLPEVDEPARLGAVLDAWDPARALVYCDEDAPVRSPIEALRGALGEARDPPIAVLIGPEGGFSSEERERLLALPYVVRLAMGPRIMRADTAAVAALALVNAAVGDYREPPS